MDLRFSPVWPWWATAILAVGLAAFAVWTYPPGSPRRRTLLALRLAAIFIALFGWGEKYFGWHDPTGKVQLALFTSFVLGALCGYKTKS